MIIDCHSHCTTVAKEHEARRIARVAAFKDGAPPPPRPTTTDDQIRASIKAGQPPANCIAELRRCVEQLGFVGCNLNPDPSGGYWTDPPLTDRWWYP